MKGSISPRCGRQRDEKAYDQAKAADYEGVILRIRCALAGLKEDHVENEAKQQVKKARQRERE